MICKLCGAEHKLIRAHVIPAAFFANSDHGDVDKSVMYTFASNTYPKRIPKGIYDRELVCDTCEKRFQDWDDYAARLLLREFSSFERTVVGGRTVAWQLASYDRLRLHLFVISVLWRAAASTHQYYRETYLGPFEALAKQAVLNKSPGGPGDFAAVFAKWHSDESPEQSYRFHSSPYRDRIDGVNLIRLYMGAFMVYVKVDQRPFPADFFPFSLSSEEPLVVVARNPHISDEFAKTQRWLTERDRLQLSERLRVK